MKKSYKWLSTILGTLILVVGCIWIIDRVELLNIDNELPKSTFTKSFWKPERTKDNISHIVKKVVGLKQLNNTNIKFGIATDNTNLFKVLRLTVLFCQI